MLLGLPASAAITFSLPGTVENAVWALGSANYPSATYNSFGTAATAWGADAIPTSGVSGAALRKISGSGYMSAAGFLYTAGASGGFRLFDDEPLANLQTVVFQGSISDVFDGMPVLSYNGGSQSIVAGFSNSVLGAGYPERAWQWDLSGIPEPITSYEILFSGHFAATSLAVATGSVFTQVIPEPSGALLGAVALFISLLRRSRA